MSMSRHGTRYTWLGARTTTCTVGTVGYFTQADGSVLPAGHSGTKAREKHLALRLDTPPVRTTILYSL